MEALLNMQKHSKVTVWAAKPLLCMETSLRMLLKHFPGGLHRNTIIVDRLGEMQLWVINSKVTEWFSVELQVK